MSLALLGFALLAGATVAGILLPLLLRGDSATASRAERADGILRDKLAQLARDREQGLIGAAEAEATEAEIGRALIANAREAEREAGQGGGRHGSRAGLASALGVVLAAGLGVYWMTGSFDLAGQGAAPRAALAAMPAVAAEHQGTQIGDAIAALRARLEEQPDDLDGWYLLARTYGTIEAYDEAAQIYRRLLESAPGAVAIRGDYAETLVQANGGVVGEEAVAAFQKILATDPGDPRARYYLALRDAQNGEAASAAEGWARILRDAPADAPYRAGIGKALETIVREAGLDPAAYDVPEPEMAAAAPGPSAAQMAAASEMSAEERQEMIRGMVSRLEQRLETESDDVAGWLQLARSQTVLGEPEVAVATLERALRANPGDPALEDALASLRDSAAQ